ncbi:hypothetical protein FQA39_LY09648 [Lamprigera yunnana]|nr:hypothetical protein FQA39_LY09648 [Lamprigera yunnana]
MHVLNTRWWDNHVSKSRDVNFYAVEMHLLQMKSKFPIKADILNNSVVDIRNNFESDSNYEEDFNLPISYLQQRLEANCQSDVAGTSSSLIECENLEQKISAQNNKEQSANYNDVQKEKYLKIEEVPTKLSEKNMFKWSGKPRKLRGVPYSFVQNNPNKLIGASQESNPDTKTMVTPITLKMTTLIHQQNSNEPYNCLLNQLS